MRAQGKTPKLIYTVPTYHNPFGVTQPPARRAEVLQVAKAPVSAAGRRSLLLARLRRGSPARSVPTTRWVVYLGSFSKTIAAGLRVGWALAPHGVREKLVLASEGVGAVSVELRN